MKFDILVEGKFDYSSRTGPFTEDDLQRHWPEYLINYGPEYMLTLLDNEGNVLRMEVGQVEEATARDWVTLAEYNTRAEADAYKGPDMSAAAKYFGGLLEPKRS